MIIDSPVPSEGVGKSSEAPSEGMSPDVSLAYREFKALVGSILIEPIALDPVREVSDRALVRK